MVGVYEIELRALLSKARYDEFSASLPRMMKLVNVESMNTSKFQSTEMDIRLRWSDKTFELVAKDGKATDVSRKEITIPLGSKNDVENLIRIFQSLGVREDHPWITHKKEYEYEYNGFTYKASLQHIENFAYILEIEYTSKDGDDGKIHNKNIRKIFSELGLKAVDNKQFSEMIKEYIKNNKA